LILGRDTHPERNLYYWGAQVLTLLGHNDNDGVGCVDLFERLKSMHDISFDLFVLALDWLFLLEAIESKGGMIHKCS